MGSNSSTGGGAGGNTGADAGFVISEEEKKRKANESGYATDYQGDLNSPKKNKTKTKNQQNLAEHERMMRENRGGNQVVQSPSTAEVSQVTATEVTTPEIDTPKEDDITIRKRKAKARGRSPTILTGVTGVTGGLTLGKPSLLGR